jgi:uncharacterized protein (TIGR02145 family)
MKKHILFLGIFMVMFGLRMNAQTLKNIHRHNLPVLQIPIDLIDKVETVDVAGTKTLRISKLFGETIQIPLTEIDSITHYTGSVNPEQLGEMRTASVMGIVRGPTGAPEMNAIVRSPYGGEETRTDPNGVFFLNDIVVYDKLGYITITKPGFHQASRSFLPLEEGSNRVNIQLLPMTQSGSFTATTGGTVTSGLLQLNFPANAIQLNGQPYTGTVNVFAAALDPSTPTMFDQMPGELLGGMNDSLRLLRSFGMASIELKDANMNELQLAEGSFAILTFNIPLSLQSDSPETIDWWSFDETIGIWKHEGEAQKLGTQYIGQASHFSWWNCDVPQNFNDFTGLINSTEGNSVENVMISMYSPTLGSGVTYTNSGGLFSGRVPRFQTLTLQAYMPCIDYDDWALAYTGDFTSAADPIESIITMSSEGLFKITGLAVNCEGQPVQAGYVRIGGQINSTNQGQFTISVCDMGEYTLQVYDTSNPDSIRASDLTTVQLNATSTSVGNIEACSVFFGVVMDIEGAIYQTVLIGNQLWMAENLKTIHFADGSELANVTVNLAWTQLNTPAWCVYNNLEGYSEIFGKLYNWYSISDPRNLCPAGWHVPSDSDWTQLTDVLGGLSVAGSRLKTNQYWMWGDNSSYTNSSGFSGIPAGSRVNISGYFYGLNSYANWWSSTESSSNNAWLRGLNDSNSNVDRSNNYKQFGYSVRCVKN